MLYHSCDGYRGGRIAWGITTASHYYNKQLDYGAPLLNFNHNFIGHYDHGYCEGPCFEYYYFHKFYVAWEGENLYCSQPDSTNRLKDWLDPLHTDQVTLDGRSVCQETIRLHHSLPRLTYHAVENIISKQEIPANYSSSYKAGTEIRILDGFHAKSQI